MRPLTARPVTLPMGLWRHVRGLLLVLAAALGCSTAASAHAIHTTHTELVMDARGITLQIRTFADDFSASVARFAGRAVPGDSSVIDAEVLRYVRSRFLVTDERGQPRRLDACGARRVDGVFLLCFRVAGSEPRGSFRIRNAMLTEFHVDQVNIVRVTHGGAPRTMFFTRASAPAAVGA